MKKNNIIFFANGIRGIYVLKELIKNSFNIVLVITSLDKKSIFQPYLEIEKIKEIKNVNEISFLKEIKSYSPSFLIVAGFSQIFKKEIIKIPKYGVLNLHAGPLPKYRGGSPLNWQLINGEDEIGISVIKMKEGIDNGNIIVSDSFKRDQNDTISDLHEKANKIFPLLTIKAIDKLSKGKVGLIQDESKAIYWHQRNDEDGFINFGMKSSEIILFIKALTTPYKGAWTFYKNQKLRIFNAEISSLKIRGTIGKIIFLQGTGPYIICSDNAIKILEYQFENNEDLKIEHGVILNR